MERGIWNEQRASKRSKKENMFIITHYPEKQNALSRRKQILSTSAKRETKNKFLITKNIMKVFILFRFLGSCNSVLFISFSEWKNSTTWSEAENVFIFESREEENLETHRKLITQAARSVS